MDSGVGPPFELSSLDFPPDEPFLVLEDLLRLLEPRFLCLLLEEDLDPPCGFLLLLAVPDLIEALFGLVAGELLFEFPSESSAIAPIS